MGEVAEKQVQLYNLVPPGTHYQLLPDINWQP